MPEMIPLERALEIVLCETPVLAPETVSLADALGRILVEELRADADVPPFDKALMDGLALRAADVARVPSNLRLDGVIPAGCDPTTLPPLEPGWAARIMTGAALPPGADAVLPVEETGPVPGDQGSVRCNAAVGPGGNVAPRGSDVRAGEIVLRAGEWLGAAEIGVLAAFGRDAILVGRRPTVAVLATGDELVPVGAAPGPGKIRNSNGPVLTALARRAGAAAIDRGIARDDPADLAGHLGRGLEADLLLVSGGVSMGDYDLVGAALRRLGVEILFERVAVRPGKPFTFGRRGRTIVCACPGNPVSGYVTFHLFVRPALRRMMGDPDPAPRTIRGRLAAPVRQRAGRTGCHQARARFEADRLVVEPVPSSGSADFVACARGNALVIVPRDAGVIDAGDEVDVLLLDDHADR